ncbi:uncharacterized protein L3040_008038 [Drepanopeziza brunnea f. sp. 'multigermtubi']|uniref:Cat eye syndrome critical region protein 5 n=1 Tax=Marssonina brunnea f. sp. multigermtubi (strain MB_m1) TaxID=1072389 RepID=K1WTV7_MARBU|nr:cat eye syndrome critical region protein 5 precursor [Drepanopeziza brunnea f. sp. 'multigermtubi' MB_m1]EKD12018.1 cat eye syndrome critical region protein 5 precursor [Drepanopeziza brunnea f. sp. 'multigermtubi' MB_m1]KAJ5035572.1 hypothetical protein L3040_008038 [Drepanopeziza brunnea f. sp. 'multigermtubi']
MASTSTTGHLEDFDITIIDTTTISPTMTSQPSSQDLARIASTLESFDITVIGRTVITPTKKKTTVKTPQPLGKNFAFSFDIDGVIYKSGELCPGALEAMTYLHENEIPFIFLTNGGGKIEDERAADMAQKLGIPILASQFIQAHTPFKNQVETLADKTVLVLGGVGNQCREVAEHYGFKRVITSADIITAYPNIYPFNEIHKDYFTKTARPLMTEGNSPPEVAAVFIYSSPRDWGLDLQILIDLFLSEKGKFGTMSPLNGNTELPNKGYLQDRQPHLFMANPDITFATKHNLPRICQGTFKLALKGMWSGMTGTELIDGEHYTQIGKPTQLQFEYGEQALREVAGEELARVYMVGDGPRSDIAGANNYLSPHGTTWSSILVQTGIHQAGTVPEHLPTVEVPNVMDAVRCALEQEGVQI